MAVDVLPTPPLWLTMAMRMNGRLGPSTGRVGALPNWSVRADLFGCGLGLATSARDEESASFSSCSGGLLRRRRMTRRMMRSIHVRRFSCSADVVRCSAAGFLMDEGRGIDGLGAV